MLFYSLALYKAKVTSPNTSVIKYKTYKLSWKFSFSVNQPISRSVTLMAQELNFLTTPTCITLRPFTFHPHTKIEMSGNGCIYPDIRQRIHCIHTTLRVLGVRIEKARMVNRFCYQFGLHVQFAESFIDVI